MEYAGFIFRNFVKFFFEMFQNVATQLEIFHRGSIKIASRGNEIKSYFKKTFTRRLATSRGNEIRRYFKEELLKEDFRLLAVTNK